MQTFLPHLSYAACAGALDTNRLAKQCVEAADLLATLLGRKWLHHRNVYAEMPMDLMPHATHPCARMWSGHEGALYDYLTQMCRELSKRGHENHIEMNARKWLLPLIQDDSWSIPSWHDETLCSAHRSVLLAKDPRHYSRLGWSEKPAERDPVTNRWPYPWPASTRTNKS